MTDSRCRDFTELEAKAHDILKKIQDIVSKQLQAFDARDDEQFSKLDKELENTVGEKERAIGALRQHAVEHGCRPGFLPDLD